MRKQFLKRQNALAFYFRFEMTQQRRWLVLPCWLADNKKKQKGGGNAVFWGDQRLVPAALRFPLSPHLDVGRKILFLQED